MAAWLSWLCQNGSLLTATDSSCSNELRVPRYSGGKCRIKTLADWAVEAVVYGGGGALLGGGLGLLLLSLMRFGYGGAGLLFFEVAWILIAGLTAAGFLFGLLFGERGINWVGRLIRHVENEDW
jgi:hypothetical protein